MKLSEKLDAQAIDVQAMANRLRSAELRELRDFAPECDDQAEDLRRAADLAREIEEMHVTPVSRSA